MAGIQLGIETVRTHTEQVGTALAERQRAAAAGLAQTITPKTATIPPPYTMTTIAVTARVSHKPNTANSFWRRVLSGVAELGGRGSAGGGGAALPRAASTRPEHLCLELPSNAAQRPPGICDN